MNAVHALLLTDVVDSTRLGQKVGDSALALLWSTHDRIARDLLREWRGREIDRADGFFLLFEATADAVGFALSYHAALASAAIPFRARAGLHVGPVTLRANAPADVERGAKPVEVEGIAKPIAARVMSIAQGGQTLMTRDAHVALGATAWPTRSHGHWRLAGIAEPVELFEVAAADGIFTPPPDAGKAYRVLRHGEVWLPAREIRHSVPAERDRFIGRLDALQQLAARLEGGSRLVSVVGTGGMGKTRLVTRFAWAHLGEYSGGAWFCDMSTARGIDGIHFAVAQGLGIPLGETDSGAQLAHAIAGRGNCLVILDNFEQVVQHAQETIGLWLDRAPLAKFVVTTREVLGIQGEEVLTLATLPAQEGVSLFIERAESARSAAANPDGSADVIEQLVRLLDGLPLAIELAAARTRVMSPRVLLARIGERFNLLSSRTGRTGRQATLRAAFDWSWDLLSPAERDALAQVSVFVGGFDLESAEAVLDLSAHAGAPWSVDVVQSLVDKSLVRQVAGDRFDLLESIREYAGERLHTQGIPPFGEVESRQATEVRHGRHFARRSSRKDRVDAMLDVQNLVAACRRAATRGDATTSIAACEGAWEVLRLSGPFRVGADLLKTAMSVAGLDESDRTRLRALLGQALLLCGDVVGARSQLEEARAATVRLGNRLQEGRCLLSLAEMNAREGRMQEARDEFSAAWAAAQELSNVPMQCAVLNGLGTYYDHLGQFQEARLQFESALRIAGEAEDRSWKGGALGNLGQLLANLGQGEKAMALYDEAIAIARSLGDRHWEANMLCNLGLLHHSEGHVEQARESLQHSLQLARELGHARLESVVLCNLGIVHEALDERSAARHAYESAVTIARGQNDRRSEGQFLGYLGLLLAREGQADEARHCLRTGMTLLREVSDQVSLAIVLCAHAQAEHLYGDANESRRALTEARAIAMESGVEPKSELAVALADAEQRAEER